ncbi:MFS transporter [Corticibacter populi]|uniref:MFS transporter n=1 Tax=Corticibacter populi TaxID=1550736 RepID=A0A3M6QM60_9BURK|nr:MFS transporter [Corticibacter populi]RMX03609.1 MFS transporter [Corticibacter populi]RZS30067.1 AAHS family benzoate transporter-like MFS transporter [Corticibacter populi]
MPPAPAHPSPSTALTPPLGPVRSQWLVVAACCVIMMTEGFDLLIYSNAIPSLLMDKDMGIDKAQAGTIGSMIFLGMLLGGVMAGRLTQSLGLARTVSYGFAGFTAATTLIALVQSGWQFGALRLLAGFGLGVVLPAGLSLARKHSQQHHGAMAISIVMSGIPLGGMLAAVVSHAIIPHWGWRPLFVAGGIIGLLAILSIAPYLGRIERQARHSDANQTVRQHDWRTILRGASLGVLVLGTLATLADLLTWYGVSVWLTQLMREFDVPFTDAMQMMFTLNTGAIVGSLLTASLAFRWGSRPVAIVAGLLASACLVLVAARVLNGWGLFAVIALLGMSAISAQNLVNALVADAFPEHYRAAAIGITLGLGRLGAVIAPVLGGHILAAGYGPSSVLLVFAVSAGVGALVLLGLSTTLSRRCLASLSPPRSRTEDQHP